jgi:transcriptional regulator
MQMLPATASRREDAMGAILDDDFTRNDAAVSSGATHRPDRGAPFDSYSDHDVTALIDEYPLAWVCPSGTEPALPALLPLLIETDAEARPVALIGHMARRNPLVGALQANPDMLALFTGPQAYVSPAMVTDSGWAPTWNYAQLRIAAKVDFRPDGGGAAIQQLIDAMERDRPTGWTTAAMGERYAPMVGAIIAFRAEIVRIEGRFKLGQDEKPERLHEILDRHPDAALVRWMRRFNPGRC